MASQQVVQVRCLGKLGVDSHIRVSLHEDKCRHPNVRCDKRAYTYPQLAHKAVVERIDLLLAVIRLLQYLLGARQKRLAALGEHDAVRGADKQLAPQFILKSLDVLTDGGLSDTTARGCNTER